MTGAYLRVKRDGKWRAIEVEYLTGDELTEMFKDRTPTELIRWIGTLCAALRDTNEGYKPPSDGGPLGHQTPDVE